MAAATSCGDLVASLKGGAHSYGLTSCFELLSYRIKRLVPSHQLIRGLQ